MTSYVRLLIHSLICTRQIILIIVLLGSIQQSLAQVGDVDSAFQEARTLAFSSRYTASIDLCKRILQKSPNYQDVQVLLGRVYFWNNQTDSSIFILKKCITQKPWEDAYVALADIWRWEKRPEESLQTANEGLTSFTKSEELMIRKIKALDDLKQFKPAYHLGDSLARLTGNSELRQLTDRIKNAMAKNLFSISYDFDYFDKQFGDPWHLVAVSYGRQTACLGRVTARVNVANRFASTGSQVELDAYPSLGKKMYAYMNAALSSGNIFPNYRSGISVYRNFPHAFEAELGVRFLYFSKATLLYVGSIGKYAGNFWFSLRPTFIATENGNRFSQSYTFITRYYLNTTFDFLTLTLSYGLSPDDRSKETLFKNDDLKSSRVQLGFQHLIRGSHVISVSAGMVKMQFIQGEKYTGNDFFTGIGYQKMF